ncbi:MAG: preprotein translocase subunit SecE [Oscillospiraceae bacterium]|nr:preprotein translocase subunit SecE [Oscillospiraceae bacterium]
MADNKKNDAKAEIDKEINKEKEKKANERNAKLVAAAKKPKRSFFQYFKEARAEFKKVTWPTPKQVLNNTSVVLTMLAVAGIALWGLDQLLEQAFKLILTR